MALPAPAGHAAPEEPEEPEPTTRFTKRLYVTQEGVIQRTSKVRARENVPSAIGYSYRERWDRTAQDPNLVARELADAKAAGYELFAFRLISGSKMPRAAMGRTIGGTAPFPCPFETDGSPNNFFIDNLYAEMRRCAVALDAATDEENPILHWPWFAKEWSELYYGTEVRAASGHTKDNFVEAHKAIIDAARALQDEFPRFIMGFQLSGHGPLTDIVGPLAEYIAEKFPAERAIIHANGLSDRGQWGQANPSVDEQMDVAFDIAAEEVPDLLGFSELLCGLQAIQPFGQNQEQYSPARWRALYGQVRAAYGDSVEIYLPSFLSDYTQPGALAAFDAENARWVAEPN